MTDHATPHIPHSTGERVSVAPIVTALLALSVVALVAIYSPKEPVEQTNAVPTIEEWHGNSAVIRPVK